MTRLTWTGIENEVKNAYFGKEIEKADWNGFEIRRRIVHVAYAVSGNAHNPTCKFQYWAYKNGRFVESANTIAKLIELLS